MSAGFFRVVRSFYLNPDEIAQRGDLIELADPSLIASLAASGRIRPADPSTKDRLRQRNPWSRPPERMFPRIERADGAQ